MTDDCLNVTDSDIALMMAMGDEDGLRIFLKRYGGRMMAFLVKYYRGTLQRCEMNEAMNVAIYNIWRFADRYDEGKGTLPSWCIRIVQRAAQSIIRRESRHRMKDLEYDAAYDPAEASVDHDEECPSDDPRLDHLQAAIEMLPPLQKAIIEADLAAGGIASARRLAENCGTSINSIYVSRKKARESLRRKIERISHEPAVGRRSS